MSEEQTSASQDFVATIINNYQTTHARALLVVEDLSDDQINWQPNPSTPSIGFHLWHLARWADQLQSAIPGMTAELGKRIGPRRQHWESEKVASTWGWDATHLGFEETGMLMDEADMSGLRLPSKDALVQYARRTFAATDEVLQAIDVPQWLEREQEQYDAEGRSTLGPSGTVGSAIVVHLTHTNRHLGMIECLRGVQGLRGTATS